MIDKATVAQILDTANIVEVVSDFVSLKRRGSGYVGLCPFHNEKTPSFSVSPARNYCHCFSCGKGGSPVGFMMELEQMSYAEALKYLAQKYHIEVHERELTDKEREEQTERESMLVINEAANKHFEDNLYNTPDGKEIGLTYFAERGFSAATIKKFRLGYSLDKRNDLYSTLVKQGYNPKYLISTGLCIDDNRGGGFDRFKGRAMFPVMNVAGKIIAFGGRTLKNEPAKYVNSPESVIFKKSRELYGLFQAKQAIVKKGKCFLVEGYADVISMHQAGFDNTVASSGTSLTEGQISMIHRFTENVTVLYDGDAAGIKASLRSIDLLLNEGLNIKVLLLPDGHDPDSFARSHSTSEIQAYIDDNETDFIQFKMQILLEGAKDDPIKRSAVIQDVVKSIAVIPNAITRSVYTKECASRLDIDENLLVKEIGKVIEQNKKREFERRQREKHGSAPDTTPKQPANEEPQEDIATALQQQEAGRADNSAIQQASSSTADKHAAILQPYERELIRYVVKYGMADFCEAADADGNTFTLNLLQYVANEMSIDNMSFSNPLYSQIFNEAFEVSAQFQEVLNHFYHTLNDEAAKMHSQGIADIQAQQLSMAEIESLENELNARIEAYTEERIKEFKVNFLEKQLCSSPVDEIRNAALSLIREKYQLSRIHTKYNHLPTENEKLTKLIPEAIYNWKSALILCQIKDLQQQIPSMQPADVERALQRLQDLFNIRSELAKYLGDRVVNPKL